MPHHLIRPTQGRAEIPSGASPGSRLYSLHSPAPVTCAFVRVLSDVSNNEFLCGMGKAERRILHKWVMDGTPRARQRRERRKQNLIALENATKELERLQKKQISGGRRSKRDVDHDEATRRIHRLYFGFPAEKNDVGVITKAAIPPAYSDDKFTRRWRMPRSLVEWLYEDITHPVHGCRYFQKGPQSIGPGVSSLQKLCAALRMICYGVPADFMDDLCDVSETVRCQSR